MLNTMRQPAHVRFKENRPLQLLAGAYFLIWIVTAYRPLYPSTWLLENLIVFVFVPTLVLTYKRVPLSLLSYTLIALFLTIHAIGAHYTYARVPFGFWLKEQFGFSRNHYDRIAHLGFGLLMAYPIREALCRLANLKGFWSYCLPFCATVTCTAIFELAEWCGASLAHPDLGAQYLGMQGDIWDAQKDMLMALVGAFVCMVLTWKFESAMTRGDRPAPPTTTGSLP